MRHLRPQTDLHIHGRDTSMLGVRSNENAKREWLRDMPCCPLMAIEHHINHCGIMSAYPPYEIVRVDQSGTFMLACLEGHGIVLVDGTWKKISAGQACLLPPFVTNSLKCQSDQLWRFAWVRYGETRESKPIVSSFSPVIGAFNGSSLEKAILGMRDEAMHAKKPAALHHWCALINHYVLAFAQPSDLDERLWRLWQEIEKNPAHDWTLSAMAQIAHVSEEHLRRLSQKELGRSPVRQLTFIRLQLAITLLTDSSEKVETIAKIVGFGSIFSFSNAFKTWYGKSPSAFRMG